MVRPTKGIRFDGVFGWVVYRGTTSCGGPGESPYVVLQIGDEEWRWFASSEQVLQLQVGESVMVWGFGYKDKSKGRRLRNVTLSTMDNEGSVRLYGKRR